MIERTEQRFDHQAGTARGRSKCANLCGTELRLSIGWKRGLARIG
jgi:hypothetical protein